MIRQLLRALAAPAAAVAALAFAPAAGAAPSPDATRVAVPFQRNGGEHAGEVAFYAHSFAGTTFVTQRGQIVHAFTGPHAPPGTAAHAAPGRPAARAPGWSLVETLVAGAAPVPRPGAPAPTRASRLLAAGAAAGTGAGAGAEQPTYASVALGEAWPGVRVDLVARGRNMEKLFTVAPGASPGQIVVQLDGALRLAPGAAGELVARTGHGEVSFTAPVAFQHLGGQRVDVPVAYRLLADNRYGFAVGAYDTRAPLVIDPLLQATYLGAGGHDEVYAIALGPTGKVYVAGQTEQAGFPGTAGGAQPAWAGGATDVVVARFDAGLTVLEQATYLGGSDWEMAYALAVNAAGEVLVGGSTFSTDFPGTAGGAQPAHAGGGMDAFVARLDANLTTLLRSTYLGSSGPDEIKALAIAPSGEVYVYGDTQSPSSNLPMLAGGAQATYSGGIHDTFVARLSADLATLHQSTYVGGGGDDLAGTGNTAIALHPSGDVVVVGRTTSTGLAHTAGAAQASHQGSDDGMATRLNGALTSIQRTTYLGGSGSDVLHGAQFNAAGELVVAGTTTSTSLPGTGTGAQPASGGGNDALVARLSGDLGSLLQATYLGGSGADTARGVAINPAGEVVVWGQTGSANLPGTAGGAQASSGGSSDLFAARLSASLGQLLQSTYFGGSNTDMHTAGGVLGAGGELYLAGTTYSSDLPGTAGAAQPGTGGNREGFVARFSANLALRSAQSITFGAQAGQTYASGGNFAIAPLATASSGLAVTYGSTTPAVCTVSGATVSTVAAGTCQLTADQAGNGSYDPAPQATQAVAIAQAGQSISFGAQPAQTYASGGSFAIAPLATASSGLAITYGSTTPAVCTVSGSTVSIVAAGSCQLTANQAGNSNYQAAAQATQTVAIGQAAQSISFGAQAGQTYASGGSFAIAPLATASSGLAVTYGSATPAVCTVSSSTVSTVAAGSCQITANQAGNASYQAAPQATQAVAIAKAAQTITFGAQAAQTYTAGGSFAIAPQASASSGLAVAYSSTTPGVCSVAGSTVTMLAVGTCTLLAQQAGNANYLAATAVSQNVALQAAAPGAPTGITVQVGHHQATVGFTAPAATGGVPLASYTVTASPGGASVTGSAAPLVLTGLQNGVAYTFAVTATNTAGATGPAGTSATTTVGLAAVSGGVQGMVGTATASLAGAGVACSFDPTGSGFAAASALPAGVQAPHGGFRFVATGCGGSATVTLVYPEPLPAGLAFWKHGPATAGATPGWFPWTGATLSPDRRTVSYTVTDNGAGDSDAAAGSIRDPFAPALAAAATSVPVDAPWALAGLAAALAWLGARRQRRATSTRD